MGALVRLDSISPRLAESFRRADRHQRRQAASTACLLAIAQAGLHGEAIDAALALLRHGGKDQPALRRKLQALSTQLDEQYLRLSEEADQQMTSEALRAFRKARAASALVFALSPDPGQLHEAVYEAIAASDNQVEAIRAAEMALSAER